MPISLPYHLHARMKKFMESEFTPEEIEDQEDFHEEHFPGVSHYWNFTVGKKKNRQCYDYKTDQISLR